MECIRKSVSQYIARRSTDNEGQTQRIDSEVILTITTLKNLANALPKAIEQADAVGRLVRIEDQCITPLAKYQ